jgi:hypothetical protein
VGQVTTSEPSLAGRWVWSYRTPWQLKRESAPDVADAWQYLIGESWHSARCWYRCIYCDGSRSNSGGHTPRVTFTGTLWIIQLSYLWFEPHHRTSGPGAPLSLVVWATQGGGGGVGWGVVGVTTIGITHNVFLSVSGVGKEKESPKWIGITSSFAFLRNSLSSSYAFELSTIIQIQTATSINDVQSSHLPS